jgi:hypothetical protein
MGEAWQIEYPESPDDTVARNIASLPSFQRAPQRKLSEEMDVAPSQISK